MRFYGSTEVSANSDPITVTYNNVTEQESGMGGSRRTSAPTIPPMPDLGLDDHRQEPWRSLHQFAESAGFVVTSVNTGKHNKGSKHYDGAAIDVRTRDKTAKEIADFIDRAQKAGLVVRDERKKPAGQQVWSGPHLHLELQSDKGGA